MGKKHKKGKLTKKQRRKIEAAVRPLMASSRIREIGLSLFDNAHPAKPLIAQVIAGRHAGGEDYCHTTAFFVLRALREQGYRVVRQDGKPVLMTGMETGGPRIISETEGAEGYIRPIKLVRTVQLGGRTGHEAADEETEA